MPDNSNNHDTDTQDTDDGITGRWFAFSSHVNLDWNDPKKHPEAKQDSELLRRIQWRDY